MYFVIDGFYPGGRESVFDDTLNGIIIPMLLKHPDFDRRDPVRFMDTPVDISYPGYTNNQIPAG